MSQIEIYDAHAHLGKWNCISILRSDAAQMVEKMDFLSVKATAISSSMAICSDFRLGNDEMINALRSYPDRFFGYITINPNYAEGMVPEILRLEQEKNIIGLKVHPAYSGISLADNRYDEPFAWANAKNGVVLVHTWSPGEVSAMVKWIEKYPHAKFLIGHSGARTGVDLSAELTHTYPNVYCDIVLSNPPANWLEYLVKKADENKILFGTDSPTFDARICYSNVLCSALKEETKAKIMGQNFKEMIGIK